MTPATKFASVRWAAKPSTATSSAPEARMLAITPESEVNARRPRNRPKTTIPATTSRRRKRRRVSATGLRSPPRVTAWASRAPRRAKSRSTPNAITSATPTVTAAVIQWSPSMAGESRPSPPTEAVLLDALGTLVTFADPVPALRRELRERVGLEVDEATAKAAVREEMRFYRSRLGRARDAASLAELRSACGDVVRRAVGAPEATLEGVTEALLAAIEFAPYPEVPGTLRALRERGLALAVVSNWDVSLHEVLERCGLVGFDAVLTSAEEATAKPAPELFLRALDRLGVAPAAALHAGDSVEEDLAGAHAAGLRAVLVDRDGTAPPGVAAVASLDGLIALAA